MRARDQNERWNWTYAGPWTNTPTSETDRLARAVRQLLAHTTPAYLLAAVGQVLTPLLERPTP